MADDRKRVLIDIQIEAEKARQEAIRLRQEISKTETDVKDLKKEIKDLSTAEEKNAEAIEKNTKELVDKESKLKGLRTEYGKYTREMSKGEQVYKTQTGLTKSLTSAFSSLGLQIFSVVGAYRLLKAGVTSVLRDYAQFEQTLTNVQTLLTYNEQTLRSGAIDVMQKYGFAIKDTNRALFDAISAGVPATESVQFLHEASRLAIGGVTDLRTAVDGLTSILNAYSLSVDKATAVSDAFYVAQKYGKTTVADLVHNIGRVAPIANIAGVSFQEMLGSLASLTKGGLNTEESVTILRQAIAALVKPAHQAGLVLKDASVPTGILALKTHGLVFALEQLNEAYRQNPDAIAAMIPNIRAFTGVAAFNSERLEELKKIIEDVYKDNESLSRAFGEQMDTVARKWEIMKAKLVAIRVEIGQRFAPAVKDLLNRLNKWLDISDTQVEIIERAQSRLNAELTILREANYTQEQRAVHIARINDEYRAYLPNLLDEEASLEEIAKFQAEVVKNMKARVIVMRYEQEIADAYNRQADAALRIQWAEQEMTRVRNSGTIKRLELTEEEHGFLKSQLGLEERAHMTEFRRLGDLGRAWDKLSSFQQETYLKIIRLLDEYSQGVSDFTEVTVNDIEAKWKGAAEGIGLDWEKMFEEIEKEGKETEFGSDMQFMEAQKLARALKTMQRKLEDDQVRIMENGLEKKIAVEKLRHKRAIEELKDRVIVEQELNGKIVELGPKELEFNKLIYDLIEQARKVHAHNMKEIYDQEYEDYEKEMKKALEKWLRDEEKKQRDTESYNRKILAYRKKYGLDESAINYELDVKNFEESEFYKTLTTEEAEYARWYIRNQYLGKIIKERQKYGLAFLKQQYERELDILETSEFFKTLTVDEQENARWQLRRKYQDIELRNREKYGLPYLREQYELELEALERSEWFKTLTVEEQERARATIRREYMNNYVLDIIDSTNKVIGMVLDANRQADQRMYNHRMNMLTEQNEAEEKILQNKLDKNLISEEAYRKRSQFLAEEYERKRIELEKEKFEEDKTRSILEAIIAGAVAIMKTMAEYGGTPAGWAASALVALETVAQVLVIESQRYARGKSPDEGYVVPGIGPWNADNIPAWLSPGEAVINARSMSDPILRAQASAINVAGGGKPFAYGGIATTSTTAPVYDDVNMTNAIYKAMLMMPNPIVYVKDIRTGIAKQVQVEVRANY